FTGICTLQIWRIHFSLRRAPNLATPWTGILQTTPGCIGSKSSARPAACDAQCRRSAGVDHLAARRLRPGMQYQTEEELAKLAGEIATTIFRPTGPARWGGKKTQW